MNITAHIVVRDAAEAAGWYANAFGAREFSRIPLPGAKVMTVELAFGDSIVHVGSEFLSTSAAPCSNRSTPVSDGD